MNSYILKSKLTDKYLTEEDYQICEKNWIELGEFLKSFGNYTPLKMALAYGMNLSDQQLDQIKKSDLLGGYHLNAKRTL